MTSTPSLSGWMPALLEREEDVAALDALLEGTRDGGGATVLVEAAAGLGKTRLLDRLRRRATSGGVRVLAARASELERDLPYGIARQLLEPALVGAAEQRARLLEGPAAAAKPALGLGDPPAVSEVSPADASFSTLYGLYWLTANLSETQPLLLVIDDAHWADADSLKFLTFLAARVDDLPVMLAVAARPAADGLEGPSRLGLDPRVARIALRPLGTESLTELLADALATAPAEPFVAACADATGGNPFLLAELARTLRADGVEPSAANARLVTDLLPDSIAKAVLGRLAALPPEASDVARAVAILGDGCEPALVAALAEMDRESVTDTADLLRRANVLDGGGELRFAHPLVRSAVYAEIPAGGRDRAHRRAATLLEERQAPVERIAMQLLPTEPSGSPGVSATLIAAARAALKRGTGDAALACLVRAVREPPPDDARNQVVLLVLEAVFRGADAAPHRDLVKSELSPERVAELAADRAILRDLAGRIAMGLFFTQRQDEAAGLAERAIELAEEEGDLGRAVRLDALMISLTQMPARAARDHFERWAGRLGADSPEQRLASALHAWWGSRLGASAREMTALARSALTEGQIFDEHPDLPPPIQCIELLVSGDDLVAADAATDALIASATRRSSVMTLACGWLMRGLVAQRRGDLAAAQADGRQAFGLAEMRGFLQAIPPITAILVRTLTERGELDAADDALQTAGMAAAMPAGNWYDPVLFSRGMLRLAQGRTREGAGDLLELRDRVAAEREGLAPRYRFGAHAGRALAVLGEHDRAADIASEDLATARQWGAPSVVAEALSALGTIVGGEEGLDLLEEAVALSTGAPAPLVQAAALADLGSALRRRRRPSDAREHLREALAIARRSGAAPLARRTATELEATGERVPRHTPIGAETLTPSERRVAEMAAEGLTNREIAATLYVTIKTVESHLRATYDKLGIRSRGELARSLTPQAPAGS